MNVVWYTEDTASESKVEYGTRISDYSLSIPAVSSSLAYGSGFIHRATMKNLTPGSTTYYRVGSEITIGGKKEWLWSKEYSFKVRPNDSHLDEAVKIVAYGDMGVFPNSHQFVKAVTEREVVTNKANFFLHAGDLAYGFGNFTKWNMWFEMTESISAYVPYMICTGNRDEPEIIAERFTMPTDKLDSHVSLKSPNKQNFYYSFDYGWVHVAIISIKDDYSKESAQWKWLEHDLKEASHRLNNEKDPLKWIILVGHTPFYSSSNGHTGGNKELRDSIEGLLFKYGVSVAIWGDDHVYERSYPMLDGEADTSTLNLEGNVQTFIKPNKTIHLLVGTGGIELDGWKEDSAPVWSAYREKNHGYMKLEITKEVLRGRFTRQDGTIADEFAIVREISVYRISVIFLWTVPIIGGIILVARRRRFFSTSSGYVLEGKST